MKKIEKYLSNNRNVLEIGCNRGLILDQLANLNNDRVVGWDIEEDMVADAQAYFSGNDRVDIQVVDMFAIEADKMEEKFDLIVLRELFAAISMNYKQQLMPIVAQLVERNGSIVIIDFNRLAYLKYIVSAVINVPRIISTRGRYLVDFYKRYVNLFKEGRIVNCKTYYEQYADEFDIEVYNYTTALDKHYGKYYQLYNKILPSRYVVVMKKK